MQSQSLVGSKKTGLWRFFFRIGSTHAASSNAYELKSSGLFSDIGERTVAFDISGSLPLAYGMGDVSPKKPLMGGKLILSWKKLPFS